MKVQFYNLPELASKPEPTLRILHETEIISETLLLAKGDALCIGFNRYRITDREFHFEPERVSDVVLLCVADPIAVGRFRPYALSYPRTAAWQTHRAVVRRFAAISRPMNVIARYSIALSTRDSICYAILNAL
jgi:hypothetical protein